MSTGSTATRGTEMLKAIFEYSFMQNAVMASILASVICGIVGTIIVEKKLVMMSGSIAHASFGGIGLGYLIGVEPIITALAFAVSASVAAVSINRKSRTNTDIIMGMIWAVGMASGAIFISFAPGYPPDMTSYLFGDILTVTRADLLMMLVLVAIVTFVVFAFLNLLKSYIFDAEFCNVQKINTVMLDYLLLVLIAFAVVVMIRVVGIILVIALLTAPPAAVRLFTFDFRKIMIYSSVVSLIYCILGLWISYNLNISSGASIILLSGLGYLMAVSVKRIGAKRRSSSQHQQADGHNGHSGDESGD